MIHTILHRETARPFDTPRVTILSGPANYDAAEDEFETSHPDRFILAIYEGELDQNDAFNRYIEENLS